MSFSEFRRSDEFKRLNDDLNSSVPTGSFGISQQGREEKSK